MDNFPFKTVCCTVFITYNEKWKTNGRKENCKKTPNQNKPKSKSIKAPKHQSEINGKKKHAWRRARVFCISHLRNTFNFLKRSRLKRNQTAVSERRRSSDVQVLILACVFYRTVISNHGHSNLLDQ